MREILLSGHDGGPAWTVEARPTLTGPGWRAIERALADALAHVSESLGRDGVAWAGSMVGPNKRNEEVDLLALWLTFDVTGVDENALIELDTIVRAVLPDVIAEGFQPLEEPCVPVLGTDEGDLYRAWLTDGDDLVSGVLVWDDELGVSILGLEAEDPRPPGSLVLPDLVIHLAGAEGPEPHTDDPIDRLRSALLFDAGMRVHEASGRDPAVGRALVVRLGPLLLAHGLLNEAGAVDYEGLGAAVKDALAALPTALRLEAKQEVIDELRAVASAGGAITPDAAVVIGKVATLLGLA